MTLTKLGIEMLNGMNPAAMEVKLGDLLQSIGEGLVVIPITPEAGEDLVLSGVTGKDIKLKLTDAAGARKILVYDSGNVAVANIDSDGKITAVEFIGPLTGDVTGDLTGNITAAADEDLELNGVATKDVIIKLGDENSALQVLDDSEDPIAIINSDGITGTSIIGPGPYEEAETGGAPSTPQLIAAFGLVNETGAGFRGVFKDTGTEGKTYLVLNNGTNYSIIEATAAA